MLHDVQFSGGRFPAAILQHEANRGGVAVTLLRQAAWPRHDEMYTLSHWERQRESAYPAAYQSFWTQDRQTTIFNRHAAGHDGIVAYSDPYDEEAGLRAIAKSLTRLMALDVVQYRVDVANAHKVLAPVFATATESSSRASLVYLVESLPDVYDSILGQQPEQFPAPLWSLALEFREFRVGWEARLKQDTERWSRSVFPAS